MMATILNTVIVDSAILHKTLTQTSSIWLKLIHSDSTWWWQPSWTLPCMDSATAILQKDTSLSSLRFTQKHSDSTLTLTGSLILNLIGFMMATILNSSILTSAISHLALLQKTSDSNSSSDSASNLFNLTQLDDGSHLEFCHLGFSHCHLAFRHLVIFSQIHSKKTLTPFQLWFKRNESATILMMASILNSAILDSAILHQNCDSN